MSLGTRIIMILWSPQWRMCRVTYKIPSLIQSGTWWIASPGGINPVFEVGCDCEVEVSGLESVGSLAVSAVGRAAKRVERSRATLTKTSNLSIRPPEPEGFRRTDVEIACLCVVELAKQGISSAKC